MARFAVLRRPPAAELEEVVGLARLLLHLSETLVLVGVPFRSFARDLDRVLDREPVLPLADLRGGHVAALVVPLGGFHCVVEGRDRIRGELDVRDRDLRWLQVVFHDHDLEILVSELLRLAKLAGVGRLMVRALAIVLRIVNDPTRGQIRSLVHLELVNLLPDLLEVVCVKVARHRAHRLLPILRAFLGALHVLFRYRVGGQLLLLLLARLDGREGSIRQQALLLLLHRVHRVSNDRIWLHVILFRGGVQEDSHQLGPVGRVGSGLGRLHVTIKLDQALATFLRARHQLLLLGAGRRG